MMDRTSRSSNSIDGLPMARTAPWAELSISAAIVMTLMCGLSAAPARAQSQSDTERKLEQALRTIEDLSRRVRELEARVAPVPAAPASSPAPAPAPALAPAPVMATAPETDSGHGNMVTAKPPVALRGFADVGWHGTSGGVKGFTDGSLSFYLTPRLSDSVKSLIEFIFERDSNGDLTTDVERLQIGYTFENGTTAWLGRFHTPLGYWNTAYHHGQQLQLSVLRPQFIDFEDHGGILPVHTVGLLGTGAVSAGGGRVSYDLYTGNSPSIRDNTLNPNDIGRLESGSALGFNLGYLFGGNADGLKIGAHGYRGDVRDDASPANRTRLNILGAYAALDSPLWEVVAEYYDFRNDDLSGGSGQYASWAGFAQVGRRFDLWIPYARVERASLNQADKYFAMQASGRSYRRAALGLRYDLTPDSAIKTELGRTRREESPAVDFNQLLMQFAIRF
jgi:hypothetical protein